MGAGGRRQQRVGVVRALVNEGVNVVMVAAQQAAIPAKRFGTPQEFGAICAFLCSVHAGYINGQNILPDGGLYPGTY